MYEDTFVIVVTPKVWKIGTIRFNVGSITVNPLGDDGPVSPIGPVLPVSPLSPVLTNSTTIPSLSVGAAPTGF